MLNGTFQGEIEHKKVWLAQRMNYFDRLLLGTPFFSNDGGVLQNPVNVTLSGPSGATVYYTLDGSDPRLPGGAISRDAIPYQGPITIDGNMVITARSYKSNHNVGISDFTPGNEPWSGIQKRAYTLQSPPTLSITEVNYNPADPTDEELSAVPGLNNDDFEFIELHNHGDLPLDLIGTQFVNGVEFEFPATLVEPNEYVLVVRNQVGFETRLRTRLARSG